MCLLAERFRSLKRRTEQSTLLSHYENDSRVLKKKKEHFADWKRGATLWFSLGERASLFRFCGSR